MPCSCRHDAPCACGPRPGLLGRIRARAETARRVLYARTAHASKGGADVQGKHFAGGEFVPGAGGPGGGAAAKAKAKTAKTKPTTAKRQTVLPFIAKNDRTAASPAPAGPAVVAVKPKAVRAEMVPARREGKGKEARLVLADGSPAPEHVNPGAVPPDWTDVKISTDPHADVLVTAKDNKGRAKTVYSDNYTMQTEAVKFARINEMMAQKHTIAKQIQLHRRSGDAKTREDADVAWLIQEQATRPGSERDRGGKVAAYGATTLRAEHVVKGPDGVHLRFVGKEGVLHDHVVHDHALARMLTARKAAAEQGDGRLFHTNEDRLNGYIGRLDGGHFSAKDFRTLKATRLALGASARMPAPTTEKEYKAAVKAVAEHVSRVLGNKPAQCLESYINPTVFAAWRAGLAEAAPAPAVPVKRKAAARA